ncbi:hypothetical protein JXA40_02870 [bacterium]|nr:hypothetical protein [candidate division CSSED10-310 bacterium]
MKTVIFFVLTALIAEPALTRASSRPVAEPFAGFIGIDRIDPFRGELESGEVDPVQLSSWVIERMRYFEGTKSRSPDDAPHIMMAGYMDTDLSFSQGGTLTILAYVTSPAESVEQVEIYWDGDPTGVFLHDDGMHGDFGSGDELWGFSLRIDPFALTGGDYLLELRAMDSNGIYSDLWPYLTVHP